MKLLVITREFPPYIAGGISYHIYNLYTKIANHGHDITILAGRPKSVAKSESMTPPNQFDIKWVDYYSLSGYHLQFPAALYETLREIEIGNYDVSLTHTEIPYSLSIPTIHKVHDAKHRERSFNRNQMGQFTKIADSILAQTRRWTTQKAINCADTLIFNSNLTESVWMDEYEIAKPSYTIYNGVDQETFYPRDMDEKEYVLFVGDSPRKGLPAVRSFARESSYPVYTIGDINNSRHLCEKGRVGQEELADYYSSAIATIHPANFEAFGNVILESLACGTPVVVSAHCGASEIVDDSCGKVTDNLIVGVEAVRNIDSEPCVRKASGFSWDNVAMKTLHIIRNHS